MCLRQRAVKCRLQLHDLLSVCEISEIYPVGDQRFQATQAHPSIEEARITQTFDRNQLVVALQKYAFVRLTVLDQLIDRRAREGPSVDIIAQKDVNRSKRRSGSDVGTDPRQQFIEQVEATVNIAHRINPQTCRQRRAPPLYLKPLNTRK